MSLREVWHVNPLESITDFPMPCEYASCRTAHGASYSRGTGTLFSLSNLSPASTPVAVSTPSDFIIYLTLGHLFISERFDWTYGGGFARRQQGKAEIQSRRSNEGQDGTPPLKDERQSH